MKPQLPKDAYRDQMKYVSDEYEAVLKENIMLREMVIVMSNNAMELLEESEHLCRLLAVAERRNATYQ